MPKLTHTIKNLSINQFFSLLSLIVFVLPGILGSMILIKFEMDKNENHYRRYEEETVKILASAMQTPLYDFDKERDNPLIEHLLIEDKIVAIRVYDFEGEIFLEKSHENENARVRTMSRDVLYGDKPIGRVEIDFTKTGFFVFLSEYGGLYAVLFGIFLAAVIAFNYFSNFKILVPIRYLKEHSRMLSQNRLDTPIEVFNDDELGKLAETLEQMRRSLKKHIGHLDTMVKERTLELNEVNLNLEKRVAEQVEELRAKDHLLIQNAKMAAMGEMIAAIAHQWRQPISLVGMIANNIKISLELEADLSREKLNGYMDTIGTQVHYLSKTIDDFRNFFSPSKKKERFKPCETIGDVYKLVEAQIKHHNIVLSVGEHEHFEIFGSPNEFKQVLLNLFNNIRDAVDERKIVDGKIEILIENDGKTGTIQVRDNAGGIPEELLPDKLFEPYVTTKGDKGTGIGLQMSKTIIEKHLNGSLSVHNTDEGAAFIIRLPILQEEAA